MARLAIVLVLAVSLVLPPVVSGQHATQDEWPPSCADLPSWLAPAMLVELLEGYNNAPSTEARYAAHNYYTILNAEGETFRLNGRVITPEDLAAMTPEERKEIANEWLDAGYQRREHFEEYFAARDQYLAEHPELAGFVAFQERARDHPGGRG